MVKAKVMKKITIIFMILITVSIVSLSGCSDQQQNIENKNPTISISAQWLDKMDFRFSRPCFSSSTTIVLNFFIQVNSLKSLK